MTPAEFIDDPNWADFLPETKEPAHRRHLPSHEDCSRLDMETATANLRRGGVLGSMTGYEERPGQLDMLGAIVRAFNGREHLMIEAGTGVGKSLAYLIPAVLWANLNDTPVVVSTATRNLQSQLISSDIPRALKVLGDDAAKFRVALLKGRANYLCLRQVAEFFSSGFWTMSDAEQREMPNFIRWLQTTEDGDLDGYEGLPRSQLSCPGEECSVRHCPYYSRCFVYRARKRAAEAHLIVANHALVLAEATSSGGAILPAYARLVLDEAHNLEDIATEYLSYEFSMPALTHILNRLMRRGKGRRARPSGVLASVERQLQRGMLTGSDTAERIRRILADAASLTVRVVGATEEVLELAETQLLPDRASQMARYKVPVNAIDAQNRMEGEIAAMVTLLHSLRDTLDGSVPGNEFNFFADLSAQISGVAECFIGFANEANFVLSCGKDTHAYWAERVKLEKRHSYLRLVAAPLSVADDLRKYLYDVKDSVVLSSATLRVGNDFRYMIRRLGCIERFQALTATSPFDYFRQSLVLAPDCLPDPSANPQGYAEALADMLRGLFSVTRGRALVLFTSYEMMNAVASFAHAQLAEAGITLLVQGEGLSRESMTRHLKDDAATVLFGSQSFWEGVDVAGEALSCVVITRLPFAQIGDPIVEARGEQVARNGGNAFRDYTLPEAVIKFRQGFGRLIRTKRDRGVVVITDPRLTTKNYGAVFCRSLPATIHTVTSSGELLQRVGDFLAFASGCENMV